MPVGKFSILDKYMTGPAIAAKTTHNKPGRPLAFAKKLSFLKRSSRIQPIKIPMAKGARTGGKKYIIENGAMNNMANNKM